mgnify:FL=1
MKSIYTLFSLFCVVVIQAQDQYMGELPDNPEPGKCYVKQTIPDEFELKTFKVLEVPAHKTLQVIPAEYKIVRDEVVVKPATKSYKYVPATYDTTIDTVWIEEPYNKVVTSKAVFEDDYEEIELKGKSGKWVVEQDPDCLSANPDDCRVYHFREIPAVVDKIPVKKLFVPARTNTKRIGGKHKLIKRQVLLTPARTEEVLIPEEKEIVERRVLVKDEVTTEIDVPAKYRTVEKRVITKKGGIIWKEVPCKSKKNEVVVLPINFSFGSAKLTDESKSSIDLHILSKLLENDKLNVLVGSHTDSRGDMLSNQDLSERRSKSVVEYLNQKGIKTSRMIAVGYGEASLLNNCEDGVDCSESEHAKNRRTEFKFF